MDIAFNKTSIRVWDCAGIKFCITRGTFNEIGSIGRSYVEDRMTFNAYTILIYFKDDGITSLAHVSSHKAIKAEKTEKSN